jgi:putative transposase
MLPSFGAKIMGRPPRADEAGAIYHMLNRANRRAPMFLKDADYEAFEGIMAEALDRVRLRLFSYCPMQNHWRLVVSLDVDGE